MDNSPELGKEEVPLERPLSPVLSSGKKNALKFGGRLRKKTSKANLSKRFAQNEMVQGSTTRETVCLYFSDLPDPSDSPEVRLKKLQGMEERRREYLKYLTEIHTEGEHVFLSNKETDSNAFKKPLSPVVLKVKKECTQYTALQEHSHLSKATNGAFLQNVQKLSVKGNSKTSVAMCDSDTQENLNRAEKPVVPSHISDSTYSQCNTTLTDSQVNSLVDEIESVVSKNDEVKAVDTQEKNSYFKYVSQFLDKFEKQKICQQVETSNISQKQAVSDMNVHCQNIMNLISLVDKSSPSSNTDMTYKCPVFHGFEDKLVKMAKEKANRSDNLIAFYERRNKEVLHDFTKELSIFSYKNEINDQFSIPQLKSIHHNDNVVTLYENNNQKSFNLIETQDKDGFNKEKQTKEWFDSCFRKEDFKNQFSTSALEINSGVVSEVDGTNNVKADLQLKTDKSVCHSPGFGFKCASGKGIKLTESALLKASKMFEEVNPEVKLVGNERQSVNNIETLHLNSKFSNNSVKDCMTSTTTSVYNGEDSTTTAGVNSAHTLQVQSAPTVPFTCASGKKITVSKSALAKVNKIFHDIDIDPSELEKSVNVAETANVGFKTAAGNNLSVSAEVLGAAQNVFVDINQNHDDTTIICKTPTNERKTVKKHLGVSSHRSKQIPIQQSNLENAKRMFEDVTGDGLIESPFRPPMKPAFSYHSTPKRKNYGTPLVSTAVCNSSPIFFDKFGCESNNIINNTVKKEESYHTVESKVVIRSATEGNIDGWLEEMNEERRNLEQQLKLVCLKQEVLHQQKMELKTDKLKKPIAGVLFTKKRTNEKIPLRKFVENLKPGVQKFLNIDSALLNITPKTALSIHFICKSAFLETADGAKVVSNKSDLIGIAEMESAFKAMPGVQISLIPKDWIENHYKWIVWKLASMERAFSYHFRNCLTVENIMEQLKYRYDREIDKVERSALRRILEKDDSPQKRMVLCVSDIKKSNSELFELELTDGWYAVRTLIDGPLNELVKKQKLRVGYKIVTQGAELINCEGCHPLQAPECVYLKINCNSTRRAVWDARLGFQNFPGPLLIPLKSVNFKGGPVGHIKVYLARIYPLRYMERQANTVVWRNERAEEKRAKAFVTEKLRQLEDVQYEVQSNYEREIEEAQHRKKRKLDVKNSDDHPGGALYEMLMESGDPDSIMKDLTPSQLNALEDYKEHHLRKVKEVLASRLKEAMSKSRIMNRDVVPILKLLVIDASDCSESRMTLNIWKPTDELLNILKEGRVFSIYSVVPKNNGSLGSSCKTRFKEEMMSTSRFKKFSRQILPIALTLQTFYKSFLNEFDTVGIVVKTRIDSTNQDLWLSDLTGRLLLIKVCDSPDHCSVFDHLDRGQIVAISNLMLCEPQNSFGFAMGNQHTLVTRYPKDKLLKEALEVFMQQPIENMDALLNECDKKVNIYLTKLGFINTLQNKSYSETLLAQTTALNISDILTDSSEDEGVLPTKLTSLDVAMSLIDMESLGKN